ncbi:MAG TPA: alpha/beta hydrolase [Burkholderiales bacterium]|nr:alpha/beta hydrolase [Burkholderiales bacterium]
MPVDSDIQKLLDTINALPAVDFGHMPALEAARKLRVPVNVPPIPRRAAKVENRSVPGPGGDIPVRIYWPEGKGPFGAMVSFHGGGWVIGNLDSDEYKSHMLVNDSGVAIVSVDYRLAPEHTFPAAAEDCYAVTKWVYDNARSLNFDPNRLGVGGSSAGGNLSAVVPLMARDRGGPPLRFQLLTYPVCDDNFDRPSYVNNPKGKIISRAQMQWFWDMYVPDKKDRGNPYATPMREKNLRGLPPALVLTAEYDPLRDEGAAYAARLKEAGVETEHVDYEGMVHGFISVAVLHAVSTKALRHTAAAMKKYLG